MKKISVFLLIWLTGCMSVSLFAEPIHSVVVTTHRVVNIYPGSLQENIGRIARTYGWTQIVWATPNDYHWTGHVQLAATNLPDILRTILANYPLQANFYEGNHVLVIQPRTIPS